MNNQGTISKYIKKSSGRKPYVKRNKDYWQNLERQANGENLEKLEKRKKSLDMQRRVVLRYDSSFIYSYNSVARIFDISPQRVGQIHKTFPHDCPRKNLNIQKGKK